MGNPVIYCRGPSSETESSTQVVIPLQPGPDSSVWFQPALCLAPPDSAFLSCPQVTPFQLVPLPLQSFVRWPGCWPGLAQFSCSLALRHGEGASSVKWGYEYWYPPPGAGGPAWNS